MTCFNKDAYKKLKRGAKERSDVFAAATAAYDIEYNGVAVAFMPAIENTNCRMLEVAVSYCSPEDTFKPKHGKYQALNKLANGEVIKLPLAQTLRNKGSEYVATYLLNVFTV